MWNVAENTAYRLRVSGIRILDAVHEKGCGDYGPSGSHLLQDMSIQRDCGTVVCNGPDWDAPRLFSGTTRITEILGASNCPLAAQVSFTQNWQGRFLLSDRAGGISRWQNDVWGGDDPRHIRGSFCWAGSQSIWCA